MHRQCSQTDAGLWSYACDRHNAQRCLTAELAEALGALRFHGKSRCLVSRSTRTCVTTFWAPSGGDDASPLPVAVVRRSFGPARDDDFPPAFSSAMPGQFGARADLNRSDTNSGNRSDTNSPVRLCWAGSVCRPGHKGSPGDTQVVGASSILCSGAGAGRFVLDVRCRSPALKFV